MMIRLFLSSAAQGGGGEEQEQTAPRIPGLKAGPSANGASHTRPEGRVDDGLSNRYEPGSPGFSMTGFSRGR